MTVLTAAGFGLRFVSGLWISRSVPALSTTRGGEPQPVLITGVTAHQCDGEAVAELQPERSRRNLQLQRLSPSRTRDAIVMRSSCHLSALARSTETQKAVGRGVTAGGFNHNLLVGGLTPR
jgi:hypothetical protein